MRTYDCFLFFDELDLLELRLSMLDPFVDVFVLVEAPVTFAGLRKPMHFLENRDRFAPSLGKIRRVVPRLGLFTRDPWAREAASRQAVAKGLRDAAEEDLVFVSDVDEIRRPERRLDRLDSAGVARFHQELYRYFPNMRRVGPPWRSGTVRVRFADFTDAHALRLDAGALPIEDGGWHFSDVGGERKIVDNLRSSIHTEYATAYRMDGGRIRERIESGQDLLDRGFELATIPVDESFPRPVREHPERWAHLLRQASVGAMEGFRSGARRVAARVAWSGRTWMEGLRRARTGSPGSLPLFSVLLAVQDESLAEIRRSIASLRRQSCMRWEMRAVVDPGEQPAAAAELDRACGGDPRLRVEHRATGDLGDAHATALAAATGRFAMILRPGDELPPEALSHLARAVGGEPPPDVLYGDEAVIGPLGIPLHAEPKPDWSPSLLESHDYVGPLLVLRTDHARDAGGFRSGFGDAFEYDLLLRATERVGTAGVRHLPEILYHRRATWGSGAAPGRGDRAVRSDARRALEEHLARVRPGARVEPVAGWPSLHRVVDPLPSPCRVAVIVPTRDRDDLLRTCLRGVLRASGPIEIETVVVDNGSSSPETLRYLDEIAQRHGVRVLRRPEAFNFSRLCNAAVAASSSDMLCFLNNDVEARDDGWLAGLVRLATREDVGAVSPLLRYPDGRLQHLGIRVQHPWPRLIGDGASDDDVRDCIARHVVREVAAVTGGCLVTRREVFERVGRFDEELAVAYNDVDYCLRVREAGLRVLWTPFVELVHELCATRGVAPSPEKGERHAAELARFVARWGEQMGTEPYPAGIP